MAHTFTLSCCKTPRDAEISSSFPSKIFAFEIFFLPLPLKYIYNEHTKLNYKQKNTNKMKNLTKIFMAVAVAMFAFSCVNDTTEDIAVKVGGKTTLAISLGGG